MIKVLASNILSPLGRTVEQNFSSVCKGMSALKILRNWKGIPGQICAGIFSEEEKKELMLPGQTWLESLAIHSVNEALSNIKADLTTQRVGFILSTTKGNIDGLDTSDDDDDNDYFDPGTTAKRISTAIGITSEPITICNACISGVTAQIFAERLINSGKYDTVIVCGVDVVSEFCISGFLSFKALSPQPCRPFDIERLGLNLGECAATMILASSSANDDISWKIIRGHLNNDAFHVSAPSPTGEGLHRAIKHVLSGYPIDNLATICLHGTATMFNDQSESLAVSSSGLSDLPVTAYKSYYGHTLGAAGLLEPILTMKAIDEGIILPVKGFEEIGVSGKINVSSIPRQTNKDSFVKIISGFGGCNGAILYSKHKKDEENQTSKRKYDVLSEIQISPNSVQRNGIIEQYDNQGAGLLTEIFKKSVSDNSRFYKMDIFSKLVYVSTGLLIKDMLSDHNPENVSMIVFNQTSSILADWQHLSSFKDADGFYPSPTVFINTLPNVVVGEIAVQYGIKGETSFIILPQKEESLISDLSTCAISDSSSEYFISGWANANGENDFEADFKLIKTR